MLGTNTLSVIYTIVQCINYIFYYYERVVDPLPLMTCGLKLGLKAWILKLKKNHSII